MSGTALSVGQSLHPKPVTFHTNGVQNFTNVIKTSKDGPVRDTSWQWSSSESTSGPLDGCHVQGSFPIKKVQGAFHVSAQGHGFFGLHTPHEKVSMTLTKVNFTHRIDSLSFGKKYPGTRYMSNTKGL